MDRIYLGVLFLLKINFYNFNSCQICYFGILRKMVGHFTQLVRDQAYAVGCAMARYKKDNWYTTLYACDYTLANIEDYPIYEKSTKAASGCKSGKNNKYLGLCNVKEVYNDDLFYG